MFCNYVSHNKVKHEIPYLAFFTGISPECGVAVRALEQEHKGVVRGMNIRGDVTVVAAALAVGW